MLDDMEALLVLEYGLVDQSYQLAKSLLEARRTVQEGRTEVGQEIAQHAPNH